MIKLKPVEKSSFDPCIHLGLKVNNPLTVAGWGVTQEGGVDLASILQEVNVPLVDINTCRMYLGLGVTDNMLCAGKKLFIPAGRDVKLGRSIINYRHRYSPRY